MTKQMLLIFSLALVMMGTASGSGFESGADTADVSRTAAPDCEADELLSVSLSDSGLMLRSMISTSETQMLTGGRFRLTGRLSVVADDCEPTNDTAADVDALMQDCIEDSSGPQREQIGQFERLATLLGQWGLCGEISAGLSCEGDLDEDGLVGPADLQLLFSDW